MTQKEKVELRGVRVTLDGHPAVITSFRLPFGKVQIVSDGYGFEWSWEAILRIVQKGGMFKSY